MIVQLKDNQKELVKNCNDIVRFTKPVDHHIEIGKGRNRIETRLIRLYRDEQGFIEDHQWKKQIKSIYHVERTVEKLNTKTKRYNTSNEKAYYVTNKEISVKDAYDVIKRHWLIENVNHYVRDVSMLEDFSRIRVNPENMAILRSFALNIMRNNEVSNIRNCFEFIF